MGPKNNAKFLFQLFVGVCSFQAITTCVCQRESLHWAVMRSITFLVALLYGHSDCASLQIQLKSIANEAMVIRAGLKSTGKEGEGAST